MNTVTRPLALIAASLALSATLSTPTVLAEGPANRLAKPSISGANAEARRHQDGPRGRGDINVGNDVDIDIDVDNDYGNWGPHRHPIAAGIVIGTVAVTTAAVMGSYYYALPAGCTVVYHHGDTYYLCGTVHYRRTWYGNDVVYVVVDP